MKSYVLDASALFVFLQNKSSAPRVNELLKSGTRGQAEILMSAVNYGEVYGLILREHGPDRAAATMSALDPLPIRVMDATRERALRSADVKWKFKLYYADSFAASLALEYKATLVTSDADFRKLGHNFPVVWLRP